MQVNPLVIPAVVGAIALFWFGRALEGKTSSSAVKFALWTLAMGLAVPGILFVLYYVHLFDNAAWFYNLRILPYIEVAGCGLGFIAGLVHSWWQPEGAGEKMAVPSVLLILVLIPFVKPVLDPLD